MRTKTEPQTNHFKFKGKQIKKPVPHGHSGPDSCYTYGDASLYKIIIEKIEAELSSSLYTEKLPTNNTHMY